MDGQAGVDYATVWYYDGTTWSLLASPPQTPAICPPVGGISQGYWDHYTVALPASANNNPNVKIGFRWVNNNDGVGTDPSFAVDSVSLVAARSTSFTPGSTSVCKDSCVTFTNTSTGAVDSFVWSVSPVVPISNPHISPVTLCFSTTATYSVTLTPYSGGTPYPATHTVTVNPAPAPVTGAHSICVGFTTPLADASPGGTWSSSSTTVATVGSGTGVVTGVAAGTCTIAYTFSTGCTATYTFTVYPLPCTTGMPGTGNLSSVEIFPNPATDELFINVEPPTFSSYTITNEIGQALIEDQLSGPETKVNIRVLPSGLYYIMIKGTNGNVMRKFVKL